MAGSTGIFSGYDGAFLEQGAPEGQSEALPDTERSARERAEVATDRTRPFDAEVDMCELDERDRLSPVWTARATAISRSTLGIRSRRMCYGGALVLVAIHLIDAKPVVLHGRVRQCDYDGEGLYRLEVELLPLPDKPVVQAWMNED